MRNLLVCIGMAATVIVASAVARAGPGVTVTVPRTFQPASGWQNQRIRDIPAPAQFVVPQSRLAYANACAVDIGTIPDYHCMSGELIPVTKDGKPISQPLADNSCDHPVKLGLHGHSQCTPYSRLVDLSPANRPDVTIMAICRKYRPSSGPNDPMFNDLAIVAHNRTTGATCFFQSPVDGQPLDGTTVPSPMSSSTAAKSYWLEPHQANGLVKYTAPGNIDCTACHDSDPFILSPWIAQVAKTNKWDPTGKYNVDVHGSFSVAATRPWVTAGISAPQPFTQFKKCTLCHRIGGSSLHVISSGPGTEALPGIPNLHGFMPPGDDSAAGAWPYFYNEAVFELDNCVNPVSGSPAAGCNVKRAGTNK